MTPKFIVLFALVALSKSGVIPALGVATAPIIAHEVDTEYDSHPQYSYAYDVNDALTGDSKSQYETRDGDVVHGSYSLLESDGTRRTVDYTADSINGFNAVVRKEPAELALRTVAASPVHTEHILESSPIVHSAPIVHTAPVVHSAPFFHSSPIVHNEALIHSEPLSYYTSLYH